MKINTDEQIRCVKAIGRLDTNSCNDLDNALMAIPDNGGDIILDLSECPYVSSAGIRILLKAKKRQQAAHGELFLTGVATEVFQVFEMAGLHRMLRMEASVEEALTIIRAGATNKSRVTEVTIDHHHLIFQNYGEEHITGQICLTPEVLSNEELGFSIGFGSLSGGEIAAAECSDRLFTLGKCAACLPSDPSGDADFRISSDPAKSGLWVCEALSFGNHPSGSIKLTTTGLLTFKKLGEGIRSLNKGEFVAVKTTLVVLANLSKNEPSINLILVKNTTLAEVVEKYPLVQFQQMLSENSGSGDFTGVSFHLAELNLSPHEHTITDILNKHLTFENITSVNRFNPGMFLENPIGWLFQADDFVDGKTKRLTIETPPGMVFEPHKRFLARLLYTDSARVEVEQLHGGYAAQTYQVTSYDHEGRKMRPTVLKIARRELISRESERCQLYALPYIFNNCAVVLGSEFYGDTMALRYNFVGIGGESNQLKWLAHYYKNSDITVLEPIFDKIFRQILKPWYGQPVAKTIYPYKDHDPTFTFFPHIYQTVESSLSISADKQYISVPEMKHPILNPYWFLKHEYARRLEWSMEYFTGICHGDLNMQNILLDEGMNVYLIDFSETKPRSVISDFARLEAIFLIDNAPVDTEADMADYLEFIRLFYKTDHLGDTPENGYKGNHPGVVGKNVALTLKMRGYALESVKGNPDMVPYYFALLEWILPIVCYQSLELPQRRLSMIVSSLLCEKIMASGQR